MINILVDTSIFRSESFFRSKRINELFRLSCEGEIKLIMPLITINEIKAQYKKACEEVLILHNTVLNNPRINILKNFSGGADKLEKFPKLKVISDEFNEVLDRKLAEARAVILSYPTLDLTSLLDDYFNNRYPFGGGDKKHEFPDAIAIKQLEKWCLDSKKKCIIFSKDKDFLKTKSKHFEVIEDYSSYLDKLLAKLDPKRVELLGRLFSGSSIEIDKQLTVWLDDELNDESNYFTNSYDIHSIDVKEVVIQEKDYTIIAIEEKSIYIEIVAKVGISVNIEIDDEESYVYDSEDKISYYLDTTVESISKTLTVPIKAHYQIIDRDEYEDLIEIDEFNNGNKLQLRIDRWDEL